jgi:hypothetical protein
MQKTYLPYLSVIKQPAERLPKQRSMQQQLACNKVPKTAFSRGKGCLSCQRL